MILLDTNYLILALDPATPHFQRVAQWRSAGERIQITAVTWAEFLCGPVSQADVDKASFLFAAPEPLLAIDAALAAELFNINGRRRGTLNDCMIAAICIRLGASLGTDNLNDFKKLIVKGLKLV